MCISKYTSIISSLFFNRSILHLKFFSIIEVYFYILEVYFDQTSKYTSTGPDWSNGLRSKEKLLVGIAKFQNFIWTLRGIDLFGKRTAILKVGQKWGKWPLEAMRKNANIFFAMIGTELIDTLLEASCKELLENIKTFHKILKIWRSGNNILIWTWLWKSTYKVINLVQKGIGRWFMVCWKRIWMYFQKNFKYLTANVEFWSSGRLFTFGHIGAKCPWKTKTYTTLDYFMTQCIYFTSVRFTQ